MSSGYAHTIRKTTLRGPELNTIITITSDSKKDEGISEMRFYLKNFILKKKKKKKSSEFLILTLATQWLFQD